MENLWSEFRSAPSTYLQSSRTNPEALVAEMTQVCKQHDNTQYCESLINGPCHGYVHSLAEPRPFSGTPPVLMPESGGNMLMHTK